MNDLDSVNAAKLHALPAIVSALKKESKSVDLSSDVPNLAAGNIRVTADNGGNPTAHRGVPVKAFPPHNSCQRAGSGKTYRDAQNCSMDCCSVGYGFDSESDHRSVSQRQEPQQRHQHVAPRSARRDPTSADSSGSRANASSDCRVPRDAGISKGVSMTQSSAKAIRIVSIKRVLQLGHGASQASVEKLNTTGECDHEAPSSHQGSRVIQTEETEDAGGETSVVIGFLSFESLRQGTLAVSSLFLKDDTGKVRILCVPVPPPSWLGQIVCISRWTMTAAVKKLPASEETFYSCLEVSEMFQLKPPRSTTENPRASIVGGDLSACFSTGGASINNGNNEDKGDVECETEGWSCVRWYDERPTLAEVTAGGALGLEAFTTRRKRGPVDVVARVAAVSPVIRVKNAPPFFMVEVEQLEQPDRENPRHLCSRNVGGKDECLPPSRSHLSETNPRCPIKKGERERPMPEAICRSPEEIAAIFASSTETRPDSTGDPAGGVYRENGNCFAAADVPHVSRKPTVVMFRGRVLSEGVTNKVGQRGSKGCGGGGDQRSSVSEEANRESKPKEQLMTNLILNGQRCLPWQAFITPGKTYVFPAMGAFVLGGSKKMYRAFGDAAGGRVETRNIVEVRPEGSAAPDVETVGGSLCLHPGPRREADKVKLGEAVAPAESADCAETIASNGGRDDWCAGRETTLGRRSHCFVVGSTQNCDLVNRRGCQAKKCSLTEEASIAGDEEGSRGRRHPCRCVVTYEGEITGLAGQAGTYILDGGRGRAAINLYLQHLNCSMLGGGLRRGARIRVHNVHPVYCGRDVIGLGACLRTSVQVLRFSHLAGEASYRPLAGETNPRPLVVHAWRYAFNAFFLRRDLPRRRHPSVSRLVSSNTVSLSHLSQENPSLSSSNEFEELGESTGNGVRARGATALRIVTPSHALGDDRTRVDWRNLACRWVFGDSLRSTGLAKRDVYAEFLNHPEGICAIVGPEDGGCLCGAIDCDRDDDRDDMSVQGDKDGVVRALVDEKGGVTIQRADEGWHGDVLGMPDMNYKDDDRASDRQRKILQPPSPEALLRAASRTLSGSLEVAIQHAVESVLTALRGKSEYRNGSAVAVAATSAFTVRTPFGRSSGRTDGILGWLVYKEQNDNAEASSSGAISGQGSGEGFQASVCEGRKVTMPGNSFLSSEKASDQESTLWVEDRTDRAQVVLTRRTFEPKAVGGAVMAVSYQGCAPSRVNGDNRCGYGDRRKGKKRGRSWQDVEGSETTEMGDWDVDPGSASLFQALAFDGDFTSCGDRESADMAAFGLLREPALALITKFAICTDVVVLDASTAAAAAALQKPRHPTAVISEHGTGDCDQLPPSHRGATWGGASDTMRVVDGFQLILRSYIVAEKIDVSILRPQVVVGEKEDGNKADSIREDQSEGSKGLQNMEHQNTGEAQTSGACIRAVAAEVEERAGKGVRECREFSVRKALEVRLANDGLASSSGGAAALRIDPYHERESISVSGLLRGVGFRVWIDGGGRRDTGAARPTATEKGRAAVASSSADAVDKGLREPDMFARLSEAKMQLCLTLEEGSDSVCVYLAICRASWPVGMIPGSSKIVVSGLCRKLSANGKNVYLTVSRAGGGKVKVLSLGLPPPPAHVALSGSSRHPLRCYRNTVSDSRHVKICRLESNTNGLGCSCDCCSPLILFPRHQPSVHSNAHGSADGNQGETWEGLGDFREMRGGAGRWWRRGRGVISATRGGESIYLDTHPADVSPDSPLVMPLQQPLETGGPGAAAAQQHTGKQASTSSPHGHSPRASAVELADIRSSGVSGDGNASCSMSNGCSKKPMYGGAWVSTSLGNGMQEETEASPVILSVSTGPSVEAAAGLGGAEPRWDLGDMSRRGMLIRAKMKFSCLSVVGVRFVKAAAWCKSCGLIREEDLARGRCWARCDTAESWRVRWEGSANVDDGTGQALLVLDGDDVLKLLKLSTQIQRDIEKAARVYGAVSFHRAQSGPRMGINGGANAAVAIAAQDPSLAAAHSSLAAAARRASSARGNISATCVQIVKRTGGASGNPSTFGFEARAGSKRAGGSYGSVVVDVMGEGMETLTLPKVILQGTDVENLEAREEAYSVMARLRAGGAFSGKIT